MDVWKKLFSRLRQNGDQYLAILLSAVAIFIGYVGSSVETMIACTAGVLTLLAWGIVRDRDIQEVERKRKEDSDNELLLELKDLGNHLKSSEKIRFSNVQVDLQRIISKSNETLEIVTQLGSFLSSFEDRFIELGERGCRTRILVADSSYDSVVELLSIEHRGELSHTDTRIGLKNASKYLAYLADRINATDRGSMEIRLVPNTNSLHVAISDRSRNSAEVFAVLGGFKELGTKSPVISVTKAEDTALFSFLSDQFDRKWKVSREMQDLDLELKL